MGMLGKSAVFTPELIKILTIGMVNKSTKPAPNKIRLDSLKAERNSGHFMRCKKYALQATKTKIPPGKYSGMKSALIPASPKMLGNLITTAFMAFPISGKIRLITSKAPTKT